MLEDRIREELDQIRESVRLDCTREAKKIYDSDLLQQVAFYGALNVAFLTAMGFSAYLLKDEMAELPKGLLPISLHVGLMAYYLKSLFYSSAQSISSTILHRRSHIEELAAEWTQEVTAAVLDTLYKDHLQEMPQN